MSMKKISQNEDLKKKKSIPAKPSSQHKGAFKLGPHVHIRRDHEKVPEPKSRGWSCCSQTRLPSRAGNRMNLAAKQLPTNQPSHHQQAPRRMRTQDHTFHWQSAPLLFLLVMPPNFPLGQYYPGVSGKVGQRHSPPETDVGGGGGG